MRRSDRVVAAEEDPVVRREPVVVELVGGVVHPLPVPPADRGLLLRRQRLRHDRVVVDRHRVQAVPPQQGGERIYAMSFRHWRTGRMVYAKPGKPFSWVKPAAELKKAA